MPRDFRHDNHGTLVTVTPLTAAAEDWIEENVDAPSYMWIGGGVNIEHRYADAIINGMLDAGLSDQPEI